MAIAGSVEVTSEMFSFFAMLPLKYCMLTLKDFYAYVGGLQRNLSKHFRRSRRGTEVLCYELLL